MLSLEPTRPADSTAPAGGPERRVYAAIHAAILDRRLTPGTKLGEVALAELFGVSRSTVRNVLARLGHARLVELRPNRGARVASPSAEESRQIFAARRAIEGAVAGMAAAAASKKDVSGLRELVAREAAAYARGDERAGLRLSIDFHRRLAALARNDVLTRFLDELVSRTPLIVLTHRGHAPSNCGVEDHLALIEAVAGHSEKRAAELMRRHIDHLERELNLHPPPPPKTLAEVLGLPGTAR
ncbi:MAG: GntR family transcriptional regulator [Burkholderiales bacterium]